MIKFMKIYIKLHHRYSNTTVKYGTYVMTNYNSSQVYSD